MFFLKKIDSFWILVCFLVKISIFFVWFMVETKILDQPGGSKLGQMVWSCLVCHCFDKRNFGLQACLANTLLALV
jgi:hypothetical protein